MAGSDDTSIDSSDVKTVTSKLWNNILICIVISSLKSWSFFFCLFSSLPKLHNFKNDRFPHGG